MPPTDNKELEILLQVITRYTEQMVTVAENLKHVAELQEKTNSRLYNGLSKEIQDGIISSIKTCNDGCKTQHDALSKIATTNQESVSTIQSDINFVKWFIGIVGVVVIVAVVIIRSLDARAIDEAQAIKILKSIQTSISQEK